MYAHRHKNLLERTLQSSIDGYGARSWTDEASKDLYITQEIAHMKAMTKVQVQLDTYQVESALFSTDELLEHTGDSHVLGEFMRVSGKAKPNYRWDAHHIVSSGHTEAAALRGIMALLKLRINDPANGVWLPRRTQDTGQKPYERAVPHSRIHRQNYYDWLNEKLLHIRTLDQFTETLSIIEDLLLTSQFPKKVMLIKGDNRASLAEYQQPFWNGTAWADFRKL